MTLRKLSAALGLVTASFGLAVCAHAGIAPVPAGRIVGVVRDNAGVVQMGATVVLFDRYDRLVRQILTNEKGSFSFQSLGPDLYSIRVTLASFVPAVRRNIAVKAGLDSVLTINLASVLSSVELVYSAPIRGTLMSDDWKWVLRSSQATRPVLRFRSRDNTVRVSSSRSSAPPFSETRGMVSLSAGDSAATGGGGGQDLGTAFALSTSLYRGGHVHFSGNVAYLSNSGIPTAGFRTSYARDSSESTGPEVTLTVRQAFLPVRAGMGMFSLDADGGPLLRAISLGAIDRLQLLDNLSLEYGFSADSVAFMGRLNYASPFARLTYNLDGVGSLQFAYSSGAPPTDLLGRTGEGEADLQGDLEALALLPRVSLQDGHPRVQRTEDFEIGFEHVAGSRTYRAGAYQETVSNGVLTISDGEGALAGAELLPDLSSGASLVNVGNYRRSGYLASVTQTVGDLLEFSVAAGRGDALTVPHTPLSSGNAAALRSSLRSAPRPWVTMRVSSVLPRSGTRVTSSYGWTDFQSLMPAQVSLLNMGARETGWNILVRQPLPSMRGVPGRFEATAELRNALAQGYVPVDTLGNRRAMLIESPRTVRGGLSFIF